MANFAYDPVNYEFFRTLNILDLFLDVLVEELDDVMIQFSIGGICNCCLDKLNKEFFIENDTISIVTKHLSSTNLETLQSALITLMFLTTPQTKKGKENMLFMLPYLTLFCAEITSEAIVKSVQGHVLSSNKSLANLATIFLEVSTV